MSALKKVLVVGGAGYVGAVLVPKLVKAGYSTRVLDLFLFGDDVLNGSGKDVEKVKADVRDQKAVEKALEGVDAVIHLACISNDPSFELDPSLGRAVNYDCFEPLVAAAEKAGVQRFVYASTSSVYGVSEVPNVDESHPLKPLTDYSKYKALCEKVLRERPASGMTWLILRPATVCGYSPRLRLDLSVNILTNHAVNNRKITVFGGDQKRPNIHIEDMTDLYVETLRYPDAKIAGKTFNAGYQNHTILELAQKIKGVVEQEMPGKAIELVRTPTDDNRSYHISSEKIGRELGFVPKRTIEDAVRDLTSAFKAGKIPGAMTDARYYNIKTMQARGLR